LSLIYFLFKSLHFFVNFKEQEMKITKLQKIKNRKAVRNYWHSYLYDGQIMGWLFADVQGDIWGEYEAQGQTYKIIANDRSLIHQFGDFYRAYGQLPKITLREFTEKLQINEYLV